MTQTGLVVRSHGRHCLVQTPLEPGGSRYLCHFRGKHASQQTAAVVGDEVRWLPAQGDLGRIEQVLPRRSVFFRQDAQRTKMFAANVDMVLVLLAAEPEFSERQLARALIAAHAQNIGVCIVLNKRDLLAAHQRAWDRLAPYRALAYPMFSLSLRAPVAQASTSGLVELRSALAGKVSLLIGASGVGKSTLVNALVPEAGARTAELWQDPGAGQHTTTYSSWHWLGNNVGDGAVIDSPGFQDFGLQHLNPGALTSYMPDLHAHTQDCRFYNCTHRHEPGCTLVQALNNPAAQTNLSAERYKIYCELFEQLTDTRHGGVR